MAIHERLYSRLAEPPRSRAAIPALAISRYGARYATKGVFTKVVLFGAFAPAVFFLFAIWGISRNEETVIQLTNDLAQQQYRSFDDIEPEVTRDIIASVVWMLVFIQSWFATVLTALIGAHQIADDMRSHAFEVYLARPINRWDYFFGKLLVIMRPLCIAMLLPIIAVLAIAHGLLPWTFSATWMLYPQIIAAVLIWGAVASSVMLGISSTGKSPRYASVIWFILTMGSFFISSILQVSTQQTAFDMVSFNHNLFAIIRSIIQLEHALLPIDAVPIDTTRSTAPNLGILAGMSLFGTWLVARRLKSGRLP